MLDLSPGRSCPGLIEAGYALLRDGTIWFISPGEAAPASLKRITDRDSSPRKR